MKQQIIPLWENLSGCLQIFIIVSEVKTYESDLHISNPVTSEGGSHTCIQAQGIKVTVFPTGLVVLENSEGAQKFDGRGMLHNLGYQIGA